MQAKLSFRDISLMILWLAFRLSGLAATDKLIFRP